MIGSFIRVTLNGYVGEFLAEIIDVFKDGKPKIRVVHADIIGCDSAPKKNDYEVVE